MQYSFAPMEGVTSCLYRRVHAQMFPGVDRYFAPFLAPDGSGNLRRAGLRELLPEENEGIALVPQLLCNRAEAFLTVARQLAELGYREVNLNAGCPSATVVPKHKGAGMLLDLGSLEAFLAEVFARSPIAVSVKTRLGVESAAEFPAILEIYNRYPLSELIIHARDRKGMYRSAPDLAAFVAAYAGSRAPVCYNGDLFDASAVERVTALAPGLERLMLGRGVVANPALIRQLRGGPALTAEELREFLARLQGAFLGAGLGERLCLGRLKELWYYLGALFPGCPRELKRLNKAQTLPEYRAAEAALFAAGGFDPGARFRQRE